MLIARNGCDRRVIVIVNYQENNVSDLVKVLKRLGCQVDISNQADVIAASQCLILPDGTNYQGAMAKLKEMGLSSVIKAHVEAGKPLLGIGLGMHLLFEGTTVDGFTSGLDLLEGLSENLPEDQEFPLPHRGASKLIGVQEANPLTAELDGQLVIYNHLLTVDCELDQIKALSQYSVKFPAIIQEKALVGFQFLPELSQGGEQALSNFIKEL
ncbi:imidazole glycerol phosphate synthase subunit HisH [uncultured Vagococcus sp.]|uniref:imidazole glycerol phosphate synthase subunit HisH n=1 Tax=uncultured Vagococcus sp. TaxID=189676 RepID=UPI0028D44D4D|nr:imidazole glycerol phosphate synthase subunit HisH [uncultured Vagococcus sp.]